MSGFDTSSLSLSILGVVALAAIVYLVSWYKNRKSHTVVVAGESARGESRAVSDTPLRLSPMHLEIESDRRSTLYARAELRDVENYGKKFTVVWDTKGIMIAGPGEWSFSTAGGKASSNFIELKLKRDVPGEDVIMVGRIGCWITPEDSEVPFYTSASVKVGLYAEK